MTWTAETWPIACAMLPFGDRDSRGGPIQDAEPEEWARQLRQVRRLGFTEVDPTDTWVRIGDLEPSRLADFAAVLADVGLTVPAVSTSRRSVIDAEHGEEYLAYSHRVLDAAARMLGVDHATLSDLALAAPSGADGLVLFKSVVESLARHGAVRTA